MSVETIISRCTRDGVTAWSHVARQMGRSVDSVRSQYDPGYMAIRPWPHPCEEVEPPEPEDDHRSPYERGPGLKTLILAVLNRTSASAETIAGLIGTTRHSAASRLCILKIRGHVTNDGRLPCTWSITDAGRKALITARPQDVTLRLIA